MGRGDKGMGDWAPDIREGTKAVNNLKEINQKVKEGTIPRPGVAGSIAEGLAEVTDIAQNISGQGS